MGQVVLAATGVPGALPPAGMEACPGELEPPLPILLPTLWAVERHEVSGPRRGGIQPRALSLHHQGALDSG